MLKETKYESYKTGNLAKGCKLCVTGSKSVLFVTGLCSQKCYYCSLSDNKKNKDKIIINEWETSKDKEIIQEITLCGSKGAGITGGDPLLKLDRTIKLIRLLKKTFGKEFHIHLYTPLKLVNKNRLDRLYNASLDEIRFHPDIDDNRLWINIEQANKYDWDVGAEIPALPHKLKETKILIDYICNKIEFLNINELELSDNNYQDFEGLGFKPKNNESYAIMSSLKIAKKIADYANKKGIKNVHACTAVLKDKYQLARRIKKRAKNAKKPYDYLTKEGMFIRGAIYFKKNNDFKKAITILKDYDVPDELIDIDKQRKRVLTRIDVVQELKEELKQIKLKPAIVEEYPTKDCFSIEADYL